MNDLVLRENHQGAAILTLNRPDKMNALTKDVFEALEPHVDAIARVRQRRVHRQLIVFTRQSSAQNMRSPELVPRLLQSQ